MTTQPEGGIDNAQLHTVNLAAAEYLRKHGVDASVLVEDEDIPDGTAERPGDWCTCGHARDEHGETGTCLGNHRIENPDFFPGEALIDDAECYCQHFEFWYASGSQP